MRYFLRVFLLGTLPFLCGGVFAQQLSFRCKFPDGQVTDFDRGTPRTKRVSDMSDLIFDQIEQSKSTARMIGNVGAETLRVIHLGDFVHLIEITGSGNINITTIFQLDQARIKGVVPAVHSRHISLSTGPLPSQYLGTCTRLL